MTATLTRTIRPPATIRRRRRFRGRKLVLGGGLLVLLLVVWELAARANPHVQLLASSPSEVAATLVAFSGDGTFWSVHVLATAEGFAAGFVVAVVGGLGLGVLMGWRRGVRETLEPFVFVVNAVPGIALIPLFMVWFGYGFTYQVVVVASWSFFPVLLNTMAGVRAADPALLRMARSFGASTKRLLWTVALPDAAPLVFAGVQQALTHAVTGIVGAQMWASASGLGWVIANAAMNIQVEQIIAATVVVAVSGALLNELLGAVARRWTR